MSSLSRTRAKLIGNQEEQTNRVYSRVFSQFEMAREASCYVEWTIHLGSVHPEVDAMSRGQTGDLQSAGQILYH